jgi:hypothetical protein
MDFRAEHLGRAPRFDTGRITRAESSKRAEAEVLSLWERPPGQ